MCFDFGTDINGDRIIIPYASVDHIVRKDKSYVIVLTTRVTFTLPVTEDSAAMVGKYLKYWEYQLTKLTWEVQKLRMEMEDN